MEKERTVFETLQEGEGIYMPGISVDCVILGFHSGSLNVLLFRTKAYGKWGLPGGLIGLNEDMDDSAKRVLKERTGLVDVYLRQFHTFGEKDRSNQLEIKSLLKSYNIDPQKAEWFLKRHISISYYSLVRYDEAEIKMAEDEESKWFTINEVPELYLDHNQIINAAISYLRGQVGYVPMGYELLPERFTMPELRAIYEAILGREIDRRNFQRKILSIGYIIPLNETRKVGAHKSPNLYTFIKERYIEAQKYGIQLMSSNL